MDIHNKKIKKEKHEKHKDKKKHDVIHTRPKKRIGTNVKIVKPGTVVETSTKLIPPFFTDDIKPHYYNNNSMDAEDDAVLCEFSELSGDFPDFSRFARAQYLAMRDIHKDGRVSTYVFPQLLVMSRYIPHHLLEFSKDRLKIPL
jgi:hypothetical protein